ncbi:MULTISPECIES: cutinase family protein [unclassified Mycolicibacterium]|nr:MULTISPECIES: cutinase family protein [unclassified Mycolicibacterium]MUL87242.1 cutinase family protein [Mycolicibacterium sp. CBMA 331]MUM37539.1 cutinase family protein [Mycolicibacterium sp. CBMA 247]MUL81476.1 cutinase family protein [Mycolicibacterium sp. CBMA 329]MUL98476.1 cutinase family protein [Mycolicibacterium sp. CBMA 334]MUM25233.1 cutinase family protein [Mycolicibacterium sp. CBMA 295]
MWAMAAAAVLAGAAAGLTAGSAQASPGCPDVHWIGVAGSGERDDPTADAGMGRVVYNSLRDLSGWVQRDGRTMTAEAVAYPAAAVPADGDLLGWGGFMSSVDAGVAALANQYAAFTQQCPASEVVLAGYSQGAMVVHRNLAMLAGSPNLTAALLVADGDRLPADSTLNLGTATAVRDTGATAVRGTGKGVAQDWPILAHAPAVLPASVGSRTISVCDRGDAVCDYDSDAQGVTANAIAVHTSYARSSSGGFTWTWPLYRLLGPSPMQQQVMPAGGPTNGVVHS